MILDALRRKNRMMNDEAIAHRERVRRVYSTSDGQKELFNMILDCGILQVIDESRLATRNYAIKKLEEMGILDERVIKNLIKAYFESSPAVEERIESKNYGKNEGNTL